MPLADGLGPREAYAALEDYARSYGRLPLTLLMHAAVPQSFRPDLVNLIKTNFVTEAGNDLTVDADVLFSPLVEPLGASFHRLDPEVRHQCLILLDAAHKHGAERRSVSVARFLLAYVNETASKGTEDPLLKEYLAVQSWVAGAFMNPGGAASHFARALQGLAERQAVARLHLSAVATALSVPLSGYPELIAYAKGLGALASGDDAEAGRLFRGIGHDGIQIGDITLRPPAEVLRQRIKVVDKPKSTPPPAHESRQQPKMLQIYISYARDDDAPPPGGGKGFVTFLHEQLLYELKDRAENRIVIWRDTQGIMDGAQFDRNITAAIDVSSILLVVLSRNWLDQRWCQRELEAFAERWRAEGDLQIQHRIIVVGKHPVEQERLPSLLQGQVGIRFYTTDEATRDVEHAFFRGKVVDDRYFKQLDDLSRYLAHLAHRLDGDARGLIAASAALPESKLTNGHTIYVAKPAGDMQTSYDRLVKELARRGYAVVPEPAIDIPYGASAIAFVDDALARAEMSIHLLGERLGYSPEGHPSITKLQLERAAARVSSAPSEPRIGGAIYRLIWAPKAFDGVSAERDPLAVVARFDHMIPNDVIDGSNLSDFVTLVVQRAANLARSSVPERALGDDTKVYLFYPAEDIQYARQIAELLEEQGIEPLLPVFEGPARDVMAYHERQLQVCDAVIVCWAKASEVWVRSATHELSSWSALGRKRPFDWRALVAGPPPNSRKKMLSHALSRGEIDQIIDLTTFERPSIEAIGALLPHLARER